MDIEVYVHKILMGAAGKESTSNRSDFSIKIFLRSSVTVS